MSFIDFHAHILPEIDDGCNSPQMALTLMASARKHGIGIIVATPHFYPQNETVSSFLHRRKASTRSLAGICPSVPALRMGAEVLICPKMERMEGLEALCVEGTKTLLLEMPFSRVWPLELVHTAAAMQQAGLHVILAHAERYRRREVEKLLAVGVSVQINANYYTSCRKVSDVAYYLKQEKVAALGSDIHRSASRYRQYEIAARRLGAHAPLVMKRMGQLID